MWVHTNQYVRKPSKYSTEVWKSIKICKLWGRYNCKIVFNCYKEASTTTYGEKGKNKTGFWGQPCRSLDAKFWERKNIYGILLAVLKMQWLLL